jgi:hypothetical protein
MMRGVRLVAIAGVAAAAALIVLGSIDGRAALAGWLAGFVLWSGVPFGALLLAMMATLIPGRWREEIAAPAKALVVLLPLIGAAVLPILIGSRTLYPWAEEPGGVYLSMGFFAVRSIVFLAIIIVLTSLLMLRPAWALPLSAGGVILFVLLDTTLAVDWLMSLEPHFHSSGFALYVLALQANVALAIIVLMRLRIPEAKPNLLGALMLAALLVWTYLAFMQYLISWSDNLPEPVLWYRQRGTGIWSAAEFAIGALHLVLLVLLFLTSVRASRAWLRAIAGAVLLGKAIEIAWLVFPSTETEVWLGSITQLITLIVLMALSLAFLGWIARARALRPQKRAS